VCDSLEKVVDYVGTILFSDLTFVLVLVHHKRIKRIPRRCCYHGLVVHVWLPVVVVGNVFLCFRFFCGWLQNAALLLPVLTSTPSTEYSVVKYPGTGLAVSTPRSRDRKPTST
jgi:hypothetical protein